MAFLFSVVLQADAVHARSGRRSMWKHPGTSNYSVSLSIASGGAGGGEGAMLVTPTPRTGSLREILPWSVSLIGRRKRDIEMEG